MGAMISGGFAALGAAGLLAAAPPPQACRIDAVDTGELSPAEICAILALLAPSGSARSILVSMASGSQATVVVEAADGSELAAKRVTISDRSLYRGAWEKISRELAAALSRQQ